MNSVVRPWRLKSWLSQAQADSTISLTEVMSICICPRLTWMLLITVFISVMALPNRLCAQPVADSTPRVAESGQMSAKEQLQSFVKNVSSATGKFSQYTVGPQGQTKPRQSGDFSFKRPGQFKWEVLLPYRQLVVSDGKSLFQFDPDLNQVMVRPVDQAIGTSPAAILFGSGNIEQVFDLQALPEEFGLAWLRAKPKKGEAGFVQVDMGFSDGLPRQIRLLDAFGQTTQVELSNLVRNPPLEMRVFQFVPPAGVDIVKSQ